MYADHICMSMCLKEFDSILLHTPSFCLATVLFLMNPKSVGPFDSNEVQIVRYKDPAFINEFWRVQTNLTPRFSLRFRWMVRKSEKSTDGTVRGDTSLGGFGHPRAPPVDTPLVLKRWAAAPRPSRPRRGASARGRELSFGNGGAVLQGASRDVVFCARRRVGIEQSTCLPAGAPLPSPPPSAVCSHAHMHTHREKDGEDLEI